MSDTTKLKDKYVELHGFWSEGLEAALKADPLFFADYLIMAEAALGPDHLDRKMKDFVLIAANATVTHLNAEATGQHISAALKHGATRQELLEVLQIASVLGSHSLTEGTPMVIEEIEKSDDPNVKGKFPRGPRYMEVMTEFKEKRGYWNDLLDTMVRTGPDFVVGYTAFSSTPWRHGTLTPMARELLYVAIDISTTHLYEPGTRLHMRNALRYGATPEQVVQVIQLVALIGMQTFVMGVPILLEKIEQHQS